MTLRPQTVHAWSLRVLEAMHQGGTLWHGYRWYEPESGRYVPAPVPSGDRHYYLTYRADTYYVPEVVARHLWRQGLIEQGPSAAGVCYVPAGSILGTVRVEALVHASIAGMGPARDRRAA